MGDSANQHLIVDGEFFPDVQGYCGLSHLVLQVVNSTDASTMSSTIRSTDLCDSEVLIFRRYNGDLYSNFNGFYRYSS
ncbi:MAG: hypothetical protein ACI8PP_000863 [Candidatus Pseudothioglobus sp.]